MGEQLRTKHLAVSEVVRVGVTTESLKGSEAQLAEKSAVSAKNVEAGVAPLEPTKVEEATGYEGVSKFLAAEGFQSVTSGRRKLLQTIYPLHVAVTQNDA